MRASDAATTAISRSRSITESGRSFSGTGKIAGQAIGRQEDVASPTGTRAWPGPQPHYGCATNDGPRANPRRLLHRQRPVCLFAPLARNLADVTALLGDRVQGTGVSAFLAAAIKAKESVLIAEQGDVIGLLSWHVIPTLQHGPIGRISLLLVRKPSAGAG